MDDISRAIEMVKSANAELGEKEFSRLSGVPYTTIRSLAEKGFVSKPVETLKTLAQAAKERKSKRKSNTTAA